MSGTTLFLDTGGGLGPAEREALKEASATALERGLAFVDAHGDGLSRRRARVVLQAERVEALVEALAEREDGARLAPGLAESLGFEDPGRPLGADGLVDFETLSALADVRALHTAPAQAAEARLRGAQNPDGSWGDPLLPRDERLFVTGHLGGWLGATTFARPETLAAAGDFVAGLWSPEQVEGGRWSTLSAFAHFFTNVAHDEADGALQWCGRELERGFRSQRFEALQAARVLLECDAAALPAFQVDPPELLARLHGEQAADGGFAALAPGPPARRVGPTLDALRALVALNRGF